MTMNFGDNRDISVVISTYDDPINLLEQCINSLICQKEINEIIVVDSSKNDDIKEFCHSYNKINYIYTPPKGLSDARNKGMYSAKNNVIAFTDADCIADKDWAKNICFVFNTNENVAVTGGKIVPEWKSMPNKILCKSAIAQGFYSLFDMGDKLKEVDQIYGGNFAIDKNLIVGCSFLTELGRSKDNGKENLLCGEETMFCRNIKKNNLKIIYNPNMTVFHQIPVERSNFKWMWKRMYYGGISRAVVGGRPTPNEVNIPYNLYDSIFLIIFIIPYLCGLFNGILKVKKIKNYKDDEYGCY